METRSNYLIVGTAIMVLAAALAIFVVWAVKGDVDTVTKVYHTYFTGSVSGLSKVSEVRYRGVPIGAVTDIRIDPENVERVRVTLEIDGTTPIKEDSVATVEAQGITGVSYVQISGGTQGSPDLTAREDEEHPVIASRAGQLEALFADAPELINRVLRLVDEITKLVDERNRAAISGTLANIETLTATLAESSGDIGGFMADASATAAELRGAANELNNLTRELRGDLTHLVTSADETMISARTALDTVSEETALLGTGLRGATQSLTATSDEIGALVAENRRPIRDFAGDGLYQFTILINEMRTLVASLSRISEQLEADPSGFLFGDEREGFSPQ